MRWEVTKIVEKEKRKVGWGLENLGVLPLPKLLLYTVMELISHEYVPPLRKICICTERRLERWIIIESLYAYQCWYQN